MAKRTPKKVDDTRAWLAGCAEEISQYYFDLWKAVEKRQAKEVETIASGMIDLTGPALWVTDWKVDVDVAPTVAIALMQFAQLHRATLAFARVAKDLADTQADEFTYQLEVYSTYVAQFRAAIAGM